MCLCHEVYDHTGNLFFSPNFLLANLKKNPSLVTIRMVILISILYLKLDGFTYLCVDVAKYIKYNAILWGNNMTKGSWPRIIGQWIYFVIYLVFIDSTQNKLLITKRYSQNKYNSEF